MRVVQVANSVSYGDGVTNCIKYIDAVLTKNGIDTIKIALYLDQRSIKDGFKRIRLIADVITEDDILFYHMCGSGELDDEIIRLPNKKVLVFQNYTYPYFFHGIGSKQEINSSLAPDSLARTVDAFQWAITPSNFNKSCMMEQGWDANRISVLPSIAVKRGTPSNTMVKKSSTSDKVNFLYVGRMAPNKCIEDIIDMFVTYCDTYGKQSELMLVGSVAFPIYYRAIQKYIENNELYNIKHCGHVSDEELEDMYKKADVYISMSEHEGFGMPLIEAMQHGLPVFAYSCTAVTEVVSDAGMLFEHKDFKCWTNTIHEIVSHAAKVESICKKQFERVDNIYNEDLEGGLMDIVDKLKCLKKTDSIKVKPLYRLITEKELDYNADIFTNSPVVIYGAGRRGMELIDKIESCVNNVKLVVCDSNADTLDIEGIEVLAPERCFEKYPSSIYIITAQYHFVEIAFALVERGLKKEQIHYYHSGFNRIV